MAVKVGINGYGRIGRNVLRALYESGRQHELQIVAINDLCDAQSNAHLTQYDTAHGKFSGKVSVEGDALIVNGDRIKVSAKRDPAQVPWGAMGAEFVLECTGFFSTKADAGKHLQGGAKKVLISAPGGKDVDATIVYGVNHGVLKSTHTVVIRPHWMPMPSFSTLASGARQLVVHEAFETTVCVDLSTP